MMNIKKLRATEARIVIIGSTQAAIVQSILDFDYLSGKQEPSIEAIVASSGSRRNERYFWGKDEILLRRYKDFASVPEEIRLRTNLFLNMNSGRRALTSTIDALNNFPELIGGAIFAENMPEKSALEVFNRIKKHGLFILGPASVGLVMPKQVKLGPIGGLPPEHLIQSGLFKKGNVALFSASGGMVGEVITVLSQSGHGLSFACTFGGDRFPIFTPKDAFLAAESDNDTKYIVYYGELGGTDEYEVAELMKAGKITKPVYVYIAGSISEMFETPPQFGHAKAMAKNKNETAQSKRAMMKEAGAHVAASFDEFVKLLHSIPGEKLFEDGDLQKRLELIKNRKRKLFVSALSYDTNDTTVVLGKDLLERARTESFGFMAGSMFLGRNIKSKEFADLIEFIFKLLVDNGPYQSGVVNTMVSARAGRDLVSSVASGLLTIGSRFGGATNDAAKGWFYGAQSGVSAYEFVESSAKKGQIIPGIGHLKFRVDMPDPRVQALSEFANCLKIRKYLNFAKEVEKVTLAKKGTLILNVDGMMGALLLDMLVEKEGLSDAEIEQLFEIEFFNAFFVLPRMVGFIAHYLDQKRLDEGLFRFSNEEIGLIS